MPNVATSRTYVSGKPIAATRTPESAETQQADVERRVRQVVELDRDGDDGDLAADVRDRLARPEAPEGRRVAERRDVERGAADEAAEAGLALGRDLLCDRRVRGHG